MCCRLFSAAKPTLLIWGDLDRAVGLKSARELQRTLPQSRLMVLPGVGHIPFEEMPDVCNQAMRDWLINPFPSESHAPGAPFRSQPVERVTPEARGAA
jgi:4,5:9,10-diseco-3-hydroxy-5,9,17-trioxoandrosta-1(10),2-diene-4-oate hydrolase